MGKDPSMWADRRKYLLRWDVDGTITTSAGPRRSRIRGEAILMVRGDHETRRGLYLDRFGIAAQGVEARKTHTGIISVRGRSSTGAVTLGRRKDTFRIEVECDINYESLDGARGREVDKGCYYTPATEPAAAVIEGTTAVERGRVRLASGRVHVSCAAGDFEEIVAIEVQLERTTLTPLPARDVHYRFDKNGEWAPSQAGPN